jgi:hypothetical protein
VKPRHEVTRGEVEARFRMDFLTEVVGMANGRIKPENPLLLYVGQCLDNAIRKGRIAVLR